VPEENFLGLCSQEVLARGTELLKSTRKGNETVSFCSCYVQTAELIVLCCFVGALHWKLVSVYINQMGHVMLKTKSRHVAGTITKKKKSMSLAQ